MQCHRVIIIIILTVMNYNQNSQNVQHAFKKLCIIKQPIKKIFDINNNNKIFLNKS